MGRRLTACRPSISTGQEHFIFLKTLLLFHPNCYSAEIFYEAQIENLQNAFFEEMQTVIISSFLFPAARQQNSFQAT